MAVQNPKQYPGSFLKIVWGGPLYVTEQWSCSLNMGNPSLPSPAWNVDAVPQAVIDAVTAFHQTSGMIGADAKLGWIKANVIDTDGGYANDANSNVHDITTPVAGGGVTYRVPAQLAVAVSLVTAATRGLASKGRFYVPIPAMSVGTDGRLSEAQAQTVATAGATLVNALNAWGAPAHDVRVVVASGGPVRDGAVVGPGAMRNVTGVRVGRVIDTQRRRREDQVEDYVTSAVAVTP